MSGLLTHGRRLLRFGLVGGSGVLVNAGILYLLVTGAGWPHLAAALVSTEASIISNFTLNDRWTFRDAGSRGTWPVRFWRYHAVALGGLAISLAVLAALTLFLGTYYLLANLVGIAIATLWNYMVNIHCTWTLRGVATAPPRDRGTQDGEQAHLIVTAPPDEHRRTA
jgi:dolichol-phosphate mannosyltransferase